MRTLFTGKTCFAKRLARDEDGAVTVEAVIWILFFFWILALVTDASLAFFARTEAFRIVQNGNRLLSVHSLADATAEENWIEAAFTRSNNDSATTTISADKTIVSTQLSFPMQDVLLFNMFGAPSSWKITVSSQHYVEWPQP